MERPNLLVLDRTNWLDRMRRRKVAFWDASMQDRSVLLLDRPNLLLGRANMLLDRMRRLKAKFWVVSEPGIVALIAFATMVRLAARQARPFSAMAIWL